MKMLIKKASENLIILILSGIFFFHIVEFMIMMPLGPQFMRVLNIDASQFSRLVAVYNFAAGISGLLGLFWMDKWDRRNALIVMNILFALGTALCFLSTTYTQLLTARFLTGAFGGVIGALCMTIIGDLVPFERRGFAMSKLMSSFSLAAILGIPLGLSLAHHFSWQAPFIFVAAGTLIFCTLAFFRIPPLAEHLKDAKPTSLSDLVDIISEIKHIKCFVFMMLLMFSQFAVIPFISTSLVANAGMSESQLPLVYLIGGLTTAVSNPIIGRLSDIYSKQFVFRICAVLALIPLVLLTHQGLSSLIFSLSVTSLYFVFNSGRMSPAMAIITATIAPNKRGRFMSLNSAVQQSSAGLASWAGGLILTSGASGELIGFTYSGYISVAAGLLSILWVSRLEIQA